MKLEILGIDFPHKKGEFCNKAIFPYYTICCFLTPFLYLKDGALEEGEAGDILINTPNSIVYHGPIENSNNGFVNDWMHIGGDDLTALLNRYPLPLNEAFSVDEGFFIRKYLNRLISEHNSEKIGSNDIIDCVITQMIINMHRSYKKQNFYDETYQRIYNVRRAIVKNPNKNWTLKEMTDLSGYSVSRFSELYRKIYGISPINDVIEHRILLAKQLLLSGQASVEYISTACGFNSINYFSKFFKEKTGYSPTEYIKNFTE